MLSNKKSKVSDSSFRHTKSKVLCFAGPRSPTILTKTFQVCNDGFVDEEEESIAKLYEGTHNERIFQFYLSHFFTFHAERRASDAMANFLLQTCMKIER